MLRSLLIKNIAIIESAEIPFEKGLNILSGETGAGKSIVLDSIGLILGSRTQTDLIREGVEEASVEALFDVSDVTWISARCESLGLPQATSELLIKRVLSRSGKNRIYINGEMATLSMLQTLCEGLVDLCSQHDHQSLLKSATQLDLIDRYGGSQDLAKEFSIQFYAHKRSKDELHALVREEQEHRRRSDFIHFQHQELQDAAVQEGEDELLHQQKQLLQSSESRLQAAEAVRQSLEDDDGGILSLLRGAYSKARQSVAIDPNFQKIQSALERSVAEAEDALHEVQRTIQSIELDPARLSEVLERLALLATLKRKYGPTLHEVLETQKRLEAQMGDGVSFEEKISILELKIQELEKTLQTTGSKLSRKREKCAELFSTTVSAELKDLKMAGASVQVEWTRHPGPDAWCAHGEETPQFLVRTNSGEGLKSLGKMASGGELSRMMLAIRRVISDQGGIGVYLFDEIDTGMGGQTAFQVGKKLKSVAKYNQVICITHLPQVAAFADHHLSVQKTTEAKRTRTEILNLSTGDRKKEIARMLGGPEMTPKSLSNAGELIQQAKSAG